MHVHLENTPPADRLASQLEQRLGQVRETADDLRLKEALAAAFAQRLPSFARHLTLDEHLLISKGDIRAAAISLVDRLAVDAESVWMKVLAEGLLDAERRERP
ncbi:MAG: hypothetical protein VB101_01235 [Rhodospirillaceae bacterium]|nr:hypothetical protein [Rhodospirillaceae bacterium]